jgi:hypothetical protein
MQKVKIKDITTQMMKRSSLICKQYSYKKLYSTSIKEEPDLSKAYNFSASN